MISVNGFRGEYDFLSNFYRSPILYRSISYPNVENAYQAAKFIHLPVEQVTQLLGPVAMQEYNLDPTDVNIIPHLFAKLKPNIAKKLGKKLPLVGNWDEIKFDVMRELVFLKFSQNLLLKQRLLQTQDAILIETNYWHDNLWGDCMCDRCKNYKGKNMLGEILMETREKLK